jgi:hypothetical protein
MKKTANPGLKLRLNRETLRTLEESSQLEAVVGGTRALTNCVLCDGTGGRNTCLC